MTTLRHRRLAAFLGVWLVLAAACVSQAHGTPTTAPARAQVKALRIVILSTMLADAGIGEWGFAAVVEADGKRLLFDTGARPDTVLINAGELGVDLSQLSDVVLSHHHDDHTGGLLHLRQELMRKNSAALSRAHVAPGIFWSRTENGKEANPMLVTRGAYQATGGVFVEHSGPVELAPGVWLTGPIPRRFSERNWSGHKELRTPQGIAEDTLPEDQALIIDTAQGLVVVTGCGHAGIINITDFAQKRIRSAPVHAVVGGLHLLEAEPSRLDWTGAELRERGLKYLVGAHCTGIEAFFQLRQRTGLTRRTAVVGAVGGSFTLGSGLVPGRIAR